MLLLIAPPIWQLGTSRPMDGAGVRRAGGGGGGTEAGGGLRHGAGSSPISEGSEGKLRNAVGSHSCCAPCDHNRRRCCRFAFLCMSERDQGPLEAVMQGRMI